MDDTKVVLCSRLNLGFNLNYFSFYIVTSVHLNFFFFALHIFNCFYLEINQTHTITLTFQEGGHKGKNVFFNFMGVSSQNVHF